MLTGWYARKMYAWETRLTTRDENRVVRPLEWGFEWVAPFLEAHGFGSAVPDPDIARDPGAAEAAMLQINELLIRHSDLYFGYERPTDFRLEERHPQLFPTNVRPETLEQDAELKQQAAEGKIPKAEYLRFTSPERTPYPENDLVNARWFPAHGRRAVVLLPHWNSDAISYTGLCRVLNMLGIAVLRLSMPYHDIRMPAEISRADYAVSANIGRTLDAVRQGVTDIRSCLDWLEQQGYRKLGILGTSLGSCYAFIAAAHDPRIRVAAFNHASTYVADVVWHGQSTRHIRKGIESEITLETLRQSWLAVSPMAYFDQFSRWPRKSLIVYAKYDLTFLPELSRDVVAEFARRGLDYKVVVLPCGHYTMGESPYNYMDGWQLASFLRTAF
jgi:dienelactone hydrolase